MQTGLAPRCPDKLPPSVWLVAEVVLFFLKAIRCISFEKEREDCSFPVSSLHLPHFRVHSPPADVSSGSARQALVGTKHSEDASFFSPWTLLLLSSQQKTHLFLISRKVVRSCLFSRFCCVCVFVFFWLLITLVDVRWTGFLPSFSFKTRQNTRGSIKLHVCLKITSSLMRQLQFKSVNCLIRFSQRTGTQKLYQSTAF